MILKLATVAAFALIAVVAMRQGAVAQIELADAAIAMIQTTAKYADETAMAAL